MSDEEGDRCVAYALQPYPRRGYHLLLLLAGLLAAACAGGAGDVGRPGVERLNVARAARLDLATAVEVRRGVMPSLSSTPSAGPLGRFVLQTTIRDQRTIADLVGALDRERQVQAGLASPDRRASSWCSTARTA